ncbi:MAG: thiamine-phosphate kinase [Chloroflexi bacterium]|nr:thiamine-phosphate kinase [Chloroflexota bacterium]
MSDIGEFGLIDLLARLVAEEGPPAPEAADFRLRLGIGDDAAAWQVGRGTEVFTTDTAVQGVHFTLASTPWRNLGWKIMVANLSDIAAMGGEPLYTLVTLGLPPDTPVADMEELYRGMLEACREYKTAIVGGDVVGSPVAFVTVALTGVCQSSRLLTRSAAREGDVVAVTGTVGSPAGGLQVLVHGALVSTEARQHLVEAHRHPHPRLVEGRVLARAGVRCAMDVSDGLVDDLSKLCLVSGVGARVEAERVPVHPLLRKAFPQDYLRMALHGGEEYELLFTGPEELVRPLLAELLTTATIIGRVVADTPGHVVVVDGSGRELAPSGAGWDHFRA